MEREGFFSFSVEEDGERKARIHLKVPGEHFVLDALVAYALARKAGVSPEGASRGISSFKGMRRRFEVLHGKRGGILVSDYAHHPTEIRAVLNAGRKRFRGKRLAVLFQPHQFSRTRVLLNEFARVLNLFDKVFLTRIYRARDDEKEVLSVSIHDLASRIQACGGRPVVFQSLEDAGKELAALIDPMEDILFVLGAGNIVDVIPRLLEGI